MENNSSLASSPSQDDAEIERMASARFAESERIKSHKVQELFLSKQKEAEKQAVESLRRAKIEDKKKYALELSNEIVLTDEESFAMRNIFPEHLDIDQVDADIAKRTMVKKMRDEKKKTEESKAVLSMNSQPNYVSSGQAQSHAPQEAVPVGGEELVQYLMQKMGGKS